MNQFENKRNNRLHKMGLRTSDLLCILRLWKRLNKYFSTVQFWTGNDLKSEVFYCVEARQGNRSTSSEASHGFPRTRDWIDKEVIVNESAQ